MKKKHFIFIVFIFISNIIISSTIKAKPSRGYISASRINLRESPSTKAKIISKVVIGTEVKNIKLIKDGWCQLYVPSIKKTGFTLYEFITQKKPTLESVRLNLKKAKTKKEKSNLYQRLYYLSPSDYTLRKYYSQMNGFSYVSEISWDKNHKPAKEDKAVCALMSNHDGIISGTDFRPVINNWIKKSASNISQNIYKSMKSKLVKTSKSFIKKNDDLLFITGAPFVSKKISKNIFKDASGKVEVRYASQYIYETAGKVFEYTKMLNNVIITVKPEGPLPGYEAHYSKCGVGSYRYRYIKRPEIYIITSKGLERATLVSTTSAIVSEGHCTADDSFVIFATPKPVKGNIFGVFLSKKKINKTKFKMISKNKSRWFADIDGDKIADLAGIVTGKPDEIAGEGNIAIATFFINIDGKWYLANSLAEPECT